MNPEWKGILLRGSEWTVILLRGKLPEVRYVHSSKSIAYTRADALAQLHCVSAIGRDPAAQTLTVDASEYYKAP